MDRNTAAQPVDGLLYHGVPVTRAVMANWDSPEGVWWRIGADAALASVTGTPPPQAPGVPLDQLRQHAPDMRSPWDAPDALDQPTGALPFPAVPEGA